MALKLRRGTDAERQLITPEAGEPLWIDNEALWIGDGSTVGGIKVTGGIENDLATVSIDALSDVDTTSVAPTSGDALLWDGSNFTPGVPALGINDLTNVDVVSNPPSNGESLIWNGASWVPGLPAFAASGTIDGDLSGSVFGDDSTILIDGLSSELVGPIRNTSSAEFDGTTVFGQNSANPALTYYSTSTNGLFPLSVVNISNVHNDAFSNEFSLFKARGTISAQTIVQTGDTLGSLTWAGYDGVIPQVAGCIKMEVNSASAGNISADTVIATRNGGISSYTENVRFKADKGTITQGYVQFGSYTALERATITPAAGMVIWNSDTTQFEGFDGSNWINLVDGTTSP